MKVYDRTGEEFKSFALRRKDFKAEEKLDGFIVKKQLSFTYPLEDGRIYCEDIIEYGDERYRVKEAPAKGLFGSIVAAQDTRSLSGHPIRDFRVAGGTLLQCVGAALSGTGWAYEDVSAGNTDIRNISENHTDSMKLLVKIAEIFWVEIALSAKEKKVYLYQKIGVTGNAPRFMKGFNLKSLEVREDTNDFCTRIYPVGKDGLTIAEANGGVEYLDNNRYSSAVVGAIWEDTNYTDAVTLKQAAKKYLEELSAPKTAYTAQIIDVAGIYEGYGEFTFSLGDEADIIDPDLGINARERIVSITRFPDKPEKNTVELSNRAMSFSDMQKKLLAAAESIGNTSNGNIVIGSKVEGLKASQVEGLELYATRAITNLEIDNICI